MLEPNTSENFTGSSEFSIFGSAVYHSPVPRFSRTQGPGNGARRLYVTVQSWSEE